ncbi:hypothetical protein PR202_gb06576 [Eleusine coracana subsp. coracana]|uniref:Uncharacterized protein n=1 Tax=Eleusine coracana subsp. coracana TaxID=191504 RepID=A0AAV5EA97_ELECO|nr:hypothetical protein PR202_gb06576 [Eleusine coracana subsp. coracana]
MIGGSAGLDLVQAVSKGQKWAKTNPRHKRTLQRLVRVVFVKAVIGVAMAGRGRSSAAEETVAPARGRRWIDRQAVDRGIAYALMVAALVATYALH